MKPSMIATEHEPCLAIALALDPRPDEWNDNVVARGDANVYVFHDNDLSICPASAGHFFVFRNCCYRGSSRPAPFAATMADHHGVRRAIALGDGSLRLLG
jgi:hypothetical protein